MITVSLLVIGMIMFLLFEYQQDSREAQIRSQGVSLTRLLSGMPMTQLIATEGRIGILQVLRYSQDNPDFLYVVVVDPGGKRLNEASIPGTIVPDSPLSQEPTSWLGERIIEDINTGHNIQEFHAPVIVAGNLAGYVRLGFIKPSFGLSRSQLSFFASLALPIFLLTTLFYFLLKREIKPLSKMNNAIEDIIDRGNFQKVEINASGELADFIQRFNNFIDLAGGRIKDLESDQLDLQTSTKFLSYKRDRIETVLQSFPDGVAVLDEAGVISFSNNKLISLLGIEPEEMLGKKPRECFSHPEVLTFLSKYEGKVVTGYSSESIVFEPETAKDKKIEVRVYPLFSPKDKSTVFGSLVVFRDVTQESLAKTSRGEFVAHIAHELKTPLNVLTMYSEALLGEDGKGEEFRIEAVNVIHDEVERLSSLINNLLSITKFEMGSMCIDRTRVKLRDLLQDSFDNVSHSGRSENIKFNLVLPTDISSVSVDKDLLRIAINNLLTNAIKYNIPEGSVTLTAEESDEKILIRVSDTGIGISDEDKTQIFDKFYRSDNEEVRSRTGHGLGLALANDIIQLHHGTLNVNSAPGKGSDFIIEFIKDASWIDKAI